MMYYVDNIPLFFFKVNIGVQIGDYMQHPKYIITKIKENTNVGGTYT